MTPKLIAIPFGRDGNKNTIYDTRQTGQAENEATWATGFPPITMQSKTDGGLPPLGLDFNGVFFDLSSNIAHMCMGGQYYFDKDYAAKINGYPKGAILLNKLNDKQYISNIDNNKIDFNTVDAEKLTAWSIISIAGIDKLLDGKINNVDFSEALNKKADASRNMTAGNGLTGGGTLETNREFTLGTPSKISGTSKNAVTEGSHTHEIDSASLTQKGIVQLSNSITSTSETEAATPKAIKDMGDKKMSPGAFGLGGRSEDYGATINRDFDQLELITQFFTVSGAWLNSPIKATSTAITGVCATIARKYDAGVTLRVDLYIEQGHFYRERRGTAWGEWKQPMSVGDFGLGGKLAITGNIFDKEFSGFYRDQSATLYPTSSNINALSVGYSKDRMNGIMFQAASLDAWIYESATRKTAKIITTNDLDSLIQVPVDQIFYFDSATPPVGFIARNGQAIDKAKMPKLFAKYGANMPDDRDRVHRMTGTLAGAVGTTQEDAIRNITAKFDNYDGGFAEGAIQKLWGGAKGYYAEGLNAGRFEFDASLVVPTAAENRVKSRIILACNKIQ